MAKAFIVLMAALSAANIAWCCCGHHCLKPNDTCSECPINQSRGDDQGDCCPDKKPQEKPGCTHLGAGPNIEASAPADLPVVLAAGSETASADGVSICEHPARPRMTPPADGPPLYIELCTLRR